MFSLKAITCLMLLSVVKSESPFGDINVHKDYGLDIYKFLHNYNYPTETHWVHTEDGYVLRMQRISRRNGTFSADEHKPAVLLMHGLLSSAMDFVNMGPNKSLGLVLADAGFDVWLGNNRGNTWSRNHITLDPDLDKRKFWNYSFETCGFYDLTAKIDYIIKKTGQPKIFYVGHSQGTTQFFAMAALRPEYNNKIALMAALAPVAYMEHLTSPLVRIMAKYMNIMEIVMEALNIHEILSHSWILSEVAKLACSSNNPGTQELCAMFLFTLCGFNPRQLDKDLIPVLASNAPAGISAKMLIHYGQEINSGYFRRYDYGLLLNIKYYNSLTPPDYNVSAITAPVALYYSQNDFFAAVQDVERLADELPSAKKRLIPDKLFNHLDFIFAKNTNELVNLKVIEDFNEYINETYPTTPLPDHTTAKSQANLNVGNNFIITMILGILCMIYLK